MRRQRDGFAAPFHHPRSDFGDLHAWEIQPGKPLFAKGKIDPVLFRGERTKTVGKRIANRAWLARLTFVTATANAMGIIAGNRSLPILLAKEMRGAGVSRIVAVAFEGETETELTQFVDEVIWLKVGQLSKMIAAFKEAGITQCVMAGQIAPKNLFDLRPDLRAIAMLWKLKEKNAHSIFGAIADELLKEGVELVPAIPWLKSIMHPPGFKLGPELSKPQQEDVEFGFSIAKQVSKLEIGQTVVVKNGTVLATEAFEGTDACLARGGVLAGKEGGAVAVKVAKENHDLRFDLPCIGERTIETCRKAGIAVLAVEGTKTLFLDQERLITLARKYQLPVLAV